MVDALRRLGARRTERDGDRVVAQFLEPDDLDTLLRDAAAAVRASTSLADPSLSWSWQSHEEWAERWSRELEPRRVTDRLVVAPVGREPELGPDDVLIRLQPGPAFGTAEHVTTRSCIRWLERVLTPGDHVLDVGSGTGILSIAAVLLGARQALALEVDPHACATAHENVLLNGLGDRVHVRQMDVRGRTLGEMGRFQLVLANLEPDALLPLLPHIADAMTEDGWLIASGVPLAERAAAIEAAAGGGLTLQQEAADAGWWSALFRQRRRGGRPV